MALTVAGSDSGGGAGLQADLKTFQAHGVYGASVVTLVTAQNTRGVRRAVILTPDVVRDQLEAVLDDFPVAAVKTGALGDAATVAVVAQVLRGRNLPLVVDPVMIAKSGDALLQSEAVSALRELLLPLAALVTPNLPEAEVLLDLAPGALHARDGLARALTTPLPWPALLKGGHGTGDVLTDLLCLGGEPRRFEGRRVVTRHTHGTGCTLSAAVTARLALGDSLPDAVEAGLAYLRAALLEAPGLGAGAGPLEHSPSGTWGRTPPERGDSVTGPRTHVP
ncbi:hydroxymethylpyrimidine/phosphomethylpyrimidine kinase [Deinococcus aquiradiocola]|uniref:hydroxymethylpyrimidine kinase n=1 Tax=Deinococcus aquiradiocola TaxID=393059 RepID=A0A917PBC4_9DEIO|nr:hydroxymethylpyrimidine/phosphomethylpyrimidine kinase [Deinococcus aquiradiocola]